MHDGRQEAVRRNLAAQAALVWGQIEDVGRFIATGEVEVKPRGGGQPDVMTGDVSLYCEAIRRAGKFIMPDEVDKWLANEPTRDELLAVEREHPASEPAATFLPACNAPPAS